MTTAFYDARCKCDKKIGWCGVYSDRPVCPVCGYKPPPSQDAEQIELAKKMLEDKLKEDKL